MSQGHLPGVSAEIEVDRDAWCTPEWVWRIPLEAMRLDRYDLDPCSNERSSVPTIDSIRPPADGLAWRGWDGVLWMNPPYSDVTPWFEKATEAAAAGAVVWGVVPHAPNILAWVHSGPALAWSLGRVRFVAPPGVKESTPTQEHDLVCWWQAWADLGRRFDPRTVFGQVDSDPHTLYRIERCM